MALLESAGLSGHTQIQFASLAWLLPRFEAEPQRYGEHEFNLLWSLKNSLLSVADHPQISLQQAARMREQMASLYTQAGYSMRTIHFVHYHLAMGTGDRAKAEQLYNRYRQMARDMMAHCFACEADMDVEYADFMDRPAEALEHAQSCLVDWDICAEVPHRTYARVLRPLALLGRTEEGDQYQQKGYRKIRGNPEFLGRVAEHLAYLSHRNKLQIAGNMLERHLGWALSTFSLGDSYRFYLAAQHVLERLAEKKSKRKFRFPEEFPEYEASGQYDFDQLIRWFESQIKELGERFDERNGNDYFSRELPQRLRY